MDEITKLTDHAAAQNDRWLFLCLLVVVCVSVLLLWRWMVADREKTQARLVIITDRHIAQAEHLATVVANNTEALKEVRSVLGNFKTSTSK